MAKRKQWTATVAAGLTAASAGSAEAQSANTDSKNYTPNTKVIEPRYDPLPRSQLLDTDITGSVDYLAEEEKRRQQASEEGFRKGLATGLVGGAGLGVLGAGAVVRRRNRDEESPSRS